MNRRHFIQQTLAAMATSFAAPLTSMAHHPGPDEFFTVGMKKGYWWLFTPNGRPFFSIGLNHIDPASLRYPENIHIWRDKYQGSTIKWLEDSVAPNLKRWGFNTVGWEQEVTVRQWRHSRSFTYDEYRALNLPYCHMLPFTETHQWEQHTRHYDFHSSEWEDWCEYVARDHCAELSQDPNLVGYFFSDCPTWVHTNKVNEWRGPIFDPAQLESESGRKELRNLAHKYYETIYKAIRRHDTNHLILGDRYEANAPLPVEVVESALPFVDILSFQDFRDPIKHLDYWHQHSQKPVLLADAAKIKWRTVPGEFTPNNGQWYAETILELHQNPGCVGFHLCGAYQRNKARRYGLLDEQENPDSENLQPIMEANQEINRWMKENT